MDWSQNTEYLLLQIDRKQTHYELLLQFSNMESCSYSQQSHTWLSLTTLGVIFSNLKVILVTHVGIELRCLNISLVECVEACGFTQVVGHPERNKIRQSLLDKVSIAIIIGSKVFSWIIGTMGFIMGRILSLPKSMLCMWQLFNSFHNMEILQQHICF